MIFDNTYYDFFGTTKQIIEQTLATALSLGGDYADMFFEYSKCNEIALRDKQVNNARCDVDFGVGIRVISGEKNRICLL
jgi:TldD protein